MSAKKIIQEDLTPGHLRCAAASCPAVFKLADGKLLVVGERPSQAVLAEIEGKISEQEVALIIDPAYFQNLK